jgi:uncharacterized protein DUF4440
MRLAQLVLLILGSTALAAENVPATLQAKTQALLDAVSSGDAAVWAQTLDERARVVDESGQVLDRKTTVDGIRPLPAGVSGSLRVSGFQATADHDTAVTTYVAEEDETFHGARIHARYRMTDTWLKRGGAWKLLASQVQALRSDPPELPTTAEQRRAYCGRYALGDLTYEVQCEGDGLTGGTPGRPAKSLRLESPDVFFVPGEPRTRRIFQRDAAGRITGFVERRESWDLLWKRVG